MICFDKTGTLTKNMVSVSNYYCEHMLCDFPDCQHLISIQTKDKLKDAIFSTNSATLLFENPDVNLDTESLIDQKKEFNIKMDGNKID
jgi:magnesium-transporting ATPase (P-type)